MFNWETKNIPGSEHGRDAKRVPSDLLLELRVPGSPNKVTVQVQDLSSTGAQFITYLHLRPGTNIQIWIPFLDKNTPPLMRQAEVVRCRVVTGGQGYVLACAFD